MAAAAAAAAMAAWPCAGLSIVVVDEAFADAVRDSPAAKLMHR